jgi:hypothetical protein
VWVDIPEVGGGGEAAWGEIVGEGARQGGGGGGQGKWGEARREGSVRADKGHGPGERVRAVLERERELGRVGSRPRCRGRGVASPAGWRGPPATSSTAQATSAMAQAIRTGRLWSPSLALGIWKGSFMSVPGSSPSSPSSRR